MNRFKNQTVLITGALTGIGRTTALAFAREGANLVVSGRHEEAGNRLVADLHALDAQAVFLLADVTEEEQVQGLVKQTIERFGRLDVAVNNAATEGATGPIVGQTVANYRSTFETNVLGVLLCMKHELQAMVEQGGGSVVNLSSVAGQVGSPGLSVYAASKHAVEGLTKSAALEVASQGVRVNAVAPGPVETEMLDRVTGRDADTKARFLARIPAKRSGRPDEIAQTILFLASQDAPFLTGQCLAVDGGFTAG
jgi:NAD(P)-dependent dehydrogenase (short-subunit alcohol dehydrogenase family)